ncbi:MAG: VOC family protein [Coriobacteriia bacterium]
MEQRLTMVSLGVADIERATRFYRDGLGWTPSAASSGDFVLFVLAGGLGFALYPRDLLAQDSGATDTGGFGGVTLAYNVSDRAQVDRLLSAAVEAGGALLSLAIEKPWGYTGYFADPDGHPWEIAFVPSLPLRDGMLDLG